MYFKYIMTPIAAFFLGILVILLIIVPWWYVATLNTNAGTLYKNVVCHNLCNS